MVYVVLNAKNKLPRTPSSRNNVSRAISAPIASPSNGMGTHSVANDVCNSDAVVLLLATATHAAGGRLTARQTDLLAIAKAISANSRSHVRNMLLQFSTRASRSRVPLQQARGLPHGGSFYQRNTCHLFLKRKSQTEQA